MNGFEARNWMIHCLSSTHHQQIMKVKINTIKE